MRRVLLLFAHPALEKSRVHRRLLARVPAGPALTVHDLYEAYPAYDVDVAREQALLAEHDAIVLQFPFYWYSTPPLLKQWMDLVLEHGWAYGSRGRALEGRHLLCALTAGGGAGAYRPDGYNRHTVRQLLAPLEQTARLCRMRWVPPWVVHGTHALDDAALDAAAARYGALLAGIRDGSVPLDGLDAYDTLEDALAATAAAPPAPRHPEVTR